MRESHFRIIIGITLLIALYFGLDRLMTGVIAILTIEAITNYRVPILASKIRYGKQLTPSQNPGNSCSMSFTRFNIEAERMLRVVLITILIISYYVYPEHLWLLPWFMAFTLTAAGLSGICPMVIMLKKLGFR